VCHRVAASGVRPVRREVKSSSESIQFVGTAGGHIEYKLTVSLVTMATAAKAKVVILDSGDDETTRGHTSSFVIGESSNAFALGGIHCRCIIDRERCFEC
jgi:hypothetical protein